MKSILKIMLLFVSISSIQAQIPAGIFTVNGKTFNASVDTYLFRDGGRMSQIQ